ncbi:MAG: PHP domain-containing protein [Anaerolineae bacterium]|nr:PHP domain-containing protein [Anaerolineae bacterium]
MHEVRADLHIHTVLSACAEVEMIPPLIVEEALYKGLNLIAITDHNTIGNAAAVMEAAEGTGLTVLPGMELQTREEVDLLCIFGTLAAAAIWQAQVDKRLPPLENDTDVFGPQFLVDKEGEFVAEETRMLQAPATLGLEEAARVVRKLGGLAIPAHIDRQSNGLMPMLGLWPQELEADAAEVSPNIRPSEARRAFPSLPEDLTLISSSDAHWLDWMAKAITIFVLAHAPSIEEIKQALLRQGDRRTYVP